MLLSHYKLQNSFCYNPACSSTCLRFLAGAISLSKGIVSLQILKGKQNIVFNK